MNICQLERSGLSNEQDFNCGENSQAFLNPEITTNCQKVQQKIEAILNQKFSSLEDLIKVLFPNSRIFSGTSFMERSKESYSLEWILREIVQNFVDGSKKFHGVQTLDKTTFEINQDDLSTQIKIRGDWPFAEPTGLLYLFSDKKDKSDSGGNGIGLKQAALCLMRDHQVSKFLVRGKGWTVHYRIVKAVEINNLLAQKCAITSNPVQADLFLADLERDGIDRDFCTYELETANSEVLQIMQDFYKLGSGEKNPYLQNPDFENDFGSISWKLPDSLDSLKKELNQSENCLGRVYINGQISKCSEYRKGGDFWGQIKFLSLNIKNQDRFKITLDRNALDNWDVCNYAEEFINSMTKAELIEQLKQIKLLWSHRLEFSKIEFSVAGRLIEVIVSSLSSGSGLSGSEFQDLFSDNYLADDSNVSADNIKKLESRDFIILPGCFSQLKVPLARTKLTPMELAAQNKTQDVEKGRITLARGCGEMIHFPELEEIEYSEDLFYFLKTILDKHLKEAKFSATNPRTMILNLDLEVPESLSSKYLSILSKEDGEREKILQMLRGIFFYGLSEENKIFTQVTWAHSNYFSNFSIHSDDYLYVKNQGKSLAIGLYLEFGDEDVATEAQEIFTNKDYQPHWQTQQVVDGLVERFSQESRKKKRSKIKRTSARRDDISAAQSCEQSDNRAEEPPDKGLFRKFVEKLVALKSAPADSVPAPDENLPRPALSPWRAKQNNDAAKGKASGQMRFIVNTQVNSCIENIKTAELADTEDKTVAQYLQNEPEKIERGPLSEPDFSQTPQSNSNPESQAVVAENSKSLTLREELVNLGIDMTDGIKDALGKAVYQLKGRFEKFCKNFLETIDEVNVYTEYSTALAVIFSEYLTQRFTAKLPGFSALKHIFCLYRNLKTMQAEKLNVVDKNKHEQAIYNWSTETIMALAAASQESGSLNTQKMNAVLFERYKIMTELLKEMQTKVDPNADFAEFIATTLENEHGILTVASRTLQEINGILGRVEARLAQDACEVIRDIVLEPEDEFMIKFCLLLSFGPQDYLAEYEGILGKLKDKFVAAVV